MFSIQLPLFHRDPITGTGDSILIEVLEDGLIRVETDPISGPNHGNAEAFLREIATLAGGQTTVVQKRVSKVQHKQRVHLEVKKR